MFKNLFFKISANSSRINSISSFRNYFTTTNPNRPFIQSNLNQDWEYIQRISLQIKNNNLNDALKYLIQSHLHNSILNKQIYYSLQQSLIEMKMDQGYHQILYLLYRQNFLPNPLILNWMKKISHSENIKIVEQLKKDFQFIGESFPDSNLQALPNKIQIDQGIKQTKHGRKTLKVPISQTTDQYFSKTSQQITATKKQKLNKTESKPRNDTKNSAIQLQGHQFQNQFQNLLQKMFKQHGKLTLHNVQLTFDDNQQFDMQSEINQADVQHMTENYYDEYENVRLEDEFVSFLSSVSKIKIQRIEFTNDTDHISSQINHGSINDKNNNNKKH